MARKSRTHRGKSKKMLTNMFKRSNKVMGKVETGLEGIGKNVTKRAFSVVPKFTKSIKNAFGAIGVKSRRTHRRK